MSETSSSPSSPPRRTASTTAHTLPLGDGGTLAYTSSADWMVLRDGEEAIAELFHVAYTADGADPTTRPITFVFNGGPGASAAYLHVGALGPRRIQFPPDGKLPPSPVRMVDNETSWLHFTDLVFVDPVGTGFSRTLEQKKDKDGKPNPDADQQRKAFWTVDKDLESLGEFIRRFLTRHRRWASPTFIAGESYGGFRVARMLQRLQQQDGVGLCGAILISPALDFASLGGSDYDILPWIDRLPSMAAAAWVHDRLPTPKPTLEAHLAEAERFAREELVVALATGDALPAGRRDAIYARMAAITGLDPALVARCRGRISYSRFCRELLAQQGRVLGLYDASVSAIDPYPDRTHYEGPDPTLAGLDRLFVSGIYQQLRESLGVEEEIRDYQLLSYDVFRSWRYDSDGKQNQGSVMAVDELRYGMSLNDDVRVFICHGRYDLITPYFSSNRLVDLMNLSPDAHARLTLRHFEGGHMFYTWQKSREDFFATAQDFYAQATAHLR